MRIAYVCADRGIPVGGTKGASIHVRGIARAFVDRGHDVRLLAARVDPCADRLGVPVEHIGFDRQLKEIRAEVADRHDDPLLAREAFGLMMNTRARLALERLHAHWPIDAVYERYSLWSWAGVHFAREHAVPLVLEVNAPLVDEQRRYRELGLGPVAGGIEGAVLRAADALVVPSSGMRPHIARLARRRTRVHVVPNGADLELFERVPHGPPRAVAESLRGRFVIAFLGTLKPWHGVRELIEAFRRVRATVAQAHLLVIGDGPLADVVAQARREHGPAGVTWTGAVSHEEVPGWLALADVGIAPYPRLEDFYFCPLKVIEYLAAGLPVVASDQGDIDRLVRDEHTGLLVRPGDVKALVRSVVRLARKPHERERMAAHARRQARRRHGWTHAAARVEKILERVVARSREPRVEVPT